jgi:hypothetical protein
VTVADLLEALNERIKSLAGDWSKYSVVGSFVLYVVGYLALRFHLTAIGVGTDLAVLDERYLFTGARFLVYLVSAVPAIVLVSLPVAAAVWVAHRILPERAQTFACAWIKRPSPLTLFGILFAVIMIQFVMRQCFFLSDLLLARSLPAEPGWLVQLVLDDRLMPLYFSGLVAGCAVSLAILMAIRGMPGQGRMDAFARGLLGFLAAVQVLLLPINYGVLIVDKSLARVATLGDKPLGEGEEAWLVWEGKEGVTFLVRNQDRKRRALMTLPRGDAKKTEIIGFDKILPVLFGPRPEGKG